MARIVNFVDGAESETTPVIGNIVASDLIRYPDDATYESTEQGAPDGGNIYFNTTDNVIRYYNGTLWQELVDEGTVQSIENKAIDADNNMITNIDNNEIKPLAGIEATKLADGSVTDAEFQRINSVTSNVQDQIDAKQSLSEKDAANGYAGLDGSGKISASVVPDDFVQFKGMWNASTNTPTLADGVGNTGDVYRTSVAGTQDLGSGNLTFAISDWCTYNGTIWEQSDKSIEGSLDDLNDVDASSPANGEALVFNSGSGNWEASEVASVIQENIVLVGKGTAAWDEDGGNGFSQLQDQLTADIGMSNVNSSFYSAGTLEISTTSSNYKRLTVKLLTAGGPSGTVDIEIWGVDGSNEPDSANVIATFPSVTASAFTVATDAVLVSASAFSLTASTQYAIVINTTNLTTGTINFRADAGGSATGSDFFASTPGTTGTWSNSSTKDIYFILEEEVTGVGRLSLDDDSFISVPPLADDRHQIDIQDIDMASGEVAYITLDRSAGSPTSRTVTVADITSVTPDNDILIIARNVDDECYFGLHDPQRISDGETIDIQKGFTPATVLVESAVATSATGLPTSGQWADLTSIVLEPGEYDITVNGTFKMSASTNWALGINDVAGNVSPGTIGIDFAFGTALSNISLSWHRYGVVVVSTTTYYAKALRSLSGTEWGGKISARKIN